MLVDVEMRAVGDVLRGLGASPRTTPSCRSRRRSPRRTAATLHARSRHGIQVHGGIGFTWEHDMHLYFKRAKANELFLGDSAYHRELVARLIAA